MNKTTLDTQRFTAEQATVRLPLIERIASDLVEAWSQVNQKRSLLEGHTTISLLNELSEAQLLELQDDLKRLVDRVHACVKELHELGANVIEFRRGILGFSGTIEGRPVTLSWMLGEETVEFFHEEHESFDRRREIPAG